MSGEDEVVDSKDESGYAPRPGDEIVEPLLGALGCSEGRESSERRPSPRAAAWWRRMLRRVLPRKES